MDGRTDRQTDMTKLKAALRNFANAPKKNYNKKNQSLEIIYLFIYSFIHSFTHSIILLLSTDPVNAALYKPMKEFEDDVVGSNRDNIWYNITICFG